MPQTIFCTKPIRVILAESKNVSVDDFDLVSWDGESRIRRNVYNARQSVISSLPSILKDVHSIGIKTNKNKETMRDK